MKNYWLQLRPELPGLLFISAAQIWLCFSYGPWVRMESPFGVSFPVLTSIATVTFMFYIFLFPEIHLKQINLEAFDDLPDPEFAKNSFKIAMLIIFHTTIIYHWYTDYHRCTDVWYAVWYIYMIMAFLLFVRRCRRYEEV